VVLAYFVWRNEKHATTTLINLREKLLKGFPEDETPEYAREFLSLPLQHKRYLMRLTKGES
jgi:hypothetical protein